MLLNGLHSNIKSAATNNLMCYARGWAGPLSSDATAQDLIQMKAFLSPTLMHIRRLLDKLQSAVPIFGRHTVTNGVTTVSVSAVHHSSVARNIRPTAGPTNITSAESNIGNGIAFD
jgi:hypothetical protein